MRELAEDERASSDHVDSNFIDADLRLHMCGCRARRLLGWLLAEMLVAMLQHVLDPPPDHLAAPWPFIAALVRAAVAGASTAGALAVAGIGRLPLGAILREE